MQAPSVQTYTSPTSPCPLIWRLFITTIHRISLSHSLYLLSLLPYFIIPHSPLPPPLSYLEPSKPDESRWIGMIVRDLLGPSQEDMIKQLFEPTATISDPASKTLANPTAMTFAQSFHN